VANTPAPPPTAAPAPTAAAPAAPTTPATAAGITHFQIAGDSSLASYTTREKFFNQPSPVFVTGTTAAITGGLYLDRNTWQPAADPPSVITVDLRTLKTDSSRRDNAIRGRFLESDKYPLATFVLKQVAGVPQSYQEGTEVTVVLEGELTVREITKPVSWQGTAKLEGSTLTGKVGTSELKYADFGIPQITIRILAVEDWFKLDMELTAIAQ
jgi:polyisoprenoid-binding protein YceI